MLDNYSDYFDDKHHNRLVKPSYVLYVLKKLNGEIKLKNPKNSKRYVFYAEFCCKFPYSSDCINTIKKAMKVLGYDVEMASFRIDDNAKKDSRYYHKWRIQS